MWLWGGRSPQGVPVAEEERDSRADMATGTQDWEEPLGLAWKSRATVVGETLNPGCAETAERFPLRKGTGRRGRVR